MLDESEKKLSGKLYDSHGNNNEIIFNVKVLKKFKCSSFFWFRFVVQRLLISLHVSVLLFIIAVLPQNTHNMFMCVFE